MAVTVEIKEDGKVVAKFSVEETVFSTGNRGYKGWDYVTLKSKEHRAWINIVEEGAWVPPENLER